MNKSAVRLHRKSNKQLRGEKNISQRELTLSANKNPQSLERVENGKSCPTIFYKLQFCDTLDISEKDTFDKNKI